MFKYELIHEPMKSSVAFGRRLRETRLERGLTGPELASKLGLERSAIPQYESGRRSPSLAVLEKMAGILQVTLDWLVFGNQEGAQELRDKELADYFRKVDHLDSRERALVKVFLDSILAREELEEMKRAARKSEKAA